MRWGLVSEEHEERLVKYAPATTALSGSVGKRGEYVMLPSLSL